MNYIEAAFIPRCEYNNFEHERVQAEDITNETIDVLYIAMFALARNAEGRKAAKLPIAVNRIEPVNSDMYITSLSVLNSNLKLNTVCIGQFVNGFWLM